MCFYFSLYMQIHFPCLPYKYRRRPNQNPFLNLLTKSTKFPRNHNSIKSNPMYREAPPRAWPESNRLLTRWSKLEDKLFEQALVVFPEELPDRWQRIADELPGKSPVEVREHYDALVHDVCEIDSGRVELPSYVDDSAESGLSEGWDPASQISFASKPKQGDVERKKGTPWTEDEHKLFLIGLKRYGKGDWRSISRNVVVTRTPTQVASHAQKYFLRQTSGKKERKRSSIHDITTADSNLVSAPADQNWVPSVGSQGQEQLPMPNQMPDQGLGGSLEYRSFGHPV